MDVYQEIASDWEKRSLKYGTKIEGVLPKSLPTSVNNYLHEWMFKVISKVVESIDGREIKVLDLGCGYGRLSKELLNKFSHVKTLGIDISSRYVDLYNDSLSPRGKAYQADLRKLPFKNNQFDLVLVVTTLMYLIYKKDQQRALKEIFRVAKPQAQIVIIERNISAQNLLNLGGVVAFIRGKKNQEINSVSFDKDFLANLIKKSGGKIIRLEAIPFWTLLLPVSITLTIINKKIGSYFLSFLKILDKLFNWLLTPSLYISYIVVKN